MSEATEKKSLEQNHMSNVLTAVGIFLTLIIAIAQTVLVPAMWKLIDKVSVLEIKAARTESFIETFTMEGPRYTATDAEKDVGVLLGILERQGKVLDDHEGRIRTIERTLP